MSTVVNGGTLMSRGHLAMAAVVVALLAVSTGAAEGMDPLITSGGPAPFPAGAQNEMSIAIDLNPRHERTVGGRVVYPLAAGANDYVDQKTLCSTPQCEFDRAVGISGVYFSFDGSTSWRAAPYHTLPGYSKGLVTRGDPSLAFGPKRTSPGRVAWGAQSRLYYATMAERFVGRKKVARVIAVSTTDDAAKAATDAAQWAKPVIVSPNRYFADKPAIWADNAASSPNFGNVYVCWTWYGSDEEEVASGKAPAGSMKPILFRVSRDGGTTWSKTTTLSAKMTSRGRQGCAIRTDSHGSVYVAWEEYTPKRSTHLLARASAAAVQAAGSGRVAFAPARRIASVADVGRYDPNQRRLVFDGVAGARTNSWLSLAIANGAPSGSGAPDTIVVGWADARNGLNEEHALVTWSRDGGKSWAGPVNVAAERDRPSMVAVAIAPNGRYLYVVYTGFLSKWQNFTPGSTGPPRMMHSVLRSAPFPPPAAGTLAWKPDVVSPPADARASSNFDLTAEFIGDYNTAAASDHAGYTAFTDARDAADCPGLDAQRIRITRLKQLKLPASCLKGPTYFGDTNGYSLVYSPK